MRGDWRGDAGVASPLRAICAGLPGKWPERVGLAQGDCPVVPGGACACDGACLRPATTRELEQAIRDHIDGRRLA